jgi:hypothetical protein
MRAVRTWALTWVVLAAAAACGDGTTGPARVAWGRDACQHCGMAISERRYAVQIRTGSKVVRFDDFGCAVLWLDRHDDSRLDEIWAMDAEGDGWLDARAASFRPGQRTPMAYGFAAVSEAREGDVSFEAARQIILEHERERARGRNPRR